MPYNASIEMIVAISYYDGDLIQMRRWANHVAKLGSYKSHKIVIAPAHGVTTIGVKDVLESCFGEVIVENCHHTQTGWPISCNLAFEQVAWLASQKLKSYFLWMEPDAVPLKASWIDDIEEAYKACEKPFMGDFVGIAGIMPNGIDHMSGIAVYPWNMPSLAPSIFNNERTAWDIASAKDVMSKMARTTLIQHDWVPENKWRKDVVTWNDVNPLAVIYHPDKLGVLFNDNVVPNDVQGDPAMGGSSESKPHETKDTIITTGTPESVEMAIKNAINVLRFHSEIDEKNKKKIRKWLIDANLSKAKSTIKPRKKVRSVVGKRGRPKSGSGIQVPSDKKVES